MLISLFTGFWRLERLNVQSILQLHQQNCEENLGIITYYIDILYRSLCHLCHLMKKDKKLKSFMKNGIFRIVWEPRTANTYVFDVHLAVALYFITTKIFSIVLLAVVDASYKFLFIDVGSQSYGKEGGSEIFEKSKLGQHVREGSIFPPPNELPNSD